MLYPIQAMHNTQCRLPLILCPVCPTFAYDHVRPVSGGQPATRKIQLHLQILGALLRKHWPTISQKYSQGPMVFCRICMHALVHAVKEVMCREGHHL